MRGMGQLQSPIGKSLFRLIHGKLQIRELEGSSQQYARPEFDLGILSPYPLRVRLWNLLRQVSQTCTVVHDIRARHRQGIGVSDTEVQDAARKASSVYAHLVAWRHSLTPDCRYSSISPSFLYTPDTRNYAAKLYVFTDVHQAAMWIGYWCSCIHILQALSHANDLLLLQQETSPVLPRDHSGQEPKSLFESDHLRVCLLTVVDDICASAAYMLGEIDENGDLRVLLGPRSQWKALGPFYLLRGLHVANLVHGIPAAQRRWMLDRLGQIGHTWGIRAALRARKDWLDKNHASDHVTDLVPPRFPSSSDSSCTGNP